jgi:hypothetical protein
MAQRSTVAAAFVRSRTAVPWMKTSWELVARSRVAWGSGEGRFTGGVKFWWRR